MTMYIVPYLLISIITFLLLGLFNKNHFTWVHVTFAFLWPLTIITAIILSIFITIVIIRENHKKKKKNKNEKVQ
jgi:phosphotransferase system  glucose/maltose/N-acetylglucosamine-specific IIC component